MYRYYNFPGRMCKESSAVAGDALYASGGKWKLPSIIALRDDNKRLNELQGTIRGISANCYPAS